MIFLLVIKAIICRRDWNGLRGQVKHLMRPEHGPRLGYRHCKSRQWRAQRDCQGFDDRLATIVVLHAGEKRGVVFVAAGFLGRGGGRCCPLAYRLEAEIVVSRIYFYSDIF